MIHTSARALSPLVTHQLRDRASVRSAARARAAKVRQEVLLAREEAGSSRFGDDGNLGAGSRLIARTPARIGAIRSAARARARAHLFRFRRGMARAGCLSRAVRCDIRRDIGTPSRGQRVSRLERERTGAAILASTRSPMNHTPALRAFNFRCRRAGSSGDRAEGNRLRGRRRADRKTGGNGMDLRGVRASSIAEISRLLILASASPGRDATFRRELPVRSIMPGSFPDTVRAPRRPMRRSLSLSLSLSGSAVRCTRRHETR